MALEMQINPGLVLPQGWEESEQVMINNFSEQGIPKMGKKVCEFAKGLMQGKAQVVLCQQPGIPEVHFGLRR